MIVGRALGGVDCLDRLPGRIRVAVLMVSKIHRRWCIVVAPEHANAAAVLIVVSYERRDIARVKAGGDARAGHDKWRAPGCITAGAAVDVNLVPLRVGDP